MRETYLERSDVERMALLKSIVDEEKIDQLLFEEVKARGLDPDAPEVKASRRVAISAIRPMLECMLGGV